MHKLVTLPTLLALSIGLVACANQPNQNLEDARSSYSALQADSRASKLAALETQRSQAAEAMTAAAKAHEAEWCAALVQRTLGGEAAQ